LVGLIENSHHVQFKSKSNFDAYKLQYVVYFNRPGRCALWLLYLWRLSPDRQTG